MTILQIGREKIPENGWELNRWSHAVIFFSFDSEIVPILNRRSIGFFMTFCFVDARDDSV